MLQPEKKTEKTVKGKGVLHIALYKLSARAVQNNTSLAWPGLALISGYRVLVSAVLRGYRYVT